MPLLDLIRIAEPCSVAWSSMTGDDRTRHCAQCDKTVFDLSQLTRAEAEALLAAKETNLCARYYERTDGTIVLADCLVRRRRRRVVTASVVAAAALSGAGAMALTDRDPEPAAIGDVELPGDGDVEATLPMRDTRTVTDEPSSLDEPWRFGYIGGDVLSGAISFDSLEEIHVERDKVEAAAEAIRQQLAQEKLLRDVFGEPPVEGRKERRLRARLEAADPDPGVFEDE